LLLLLLFLSNW